MSTDINSLGNSHTPKKIQQYDTVSYIQQKQQAQDVKKVVAAKESSKKDSYNDSYDVQRYMQILKNMVIPPETKRDIAVLIELELRSAAGISVSELQMLIDQVEKENNERKQAKEVEKTSDTK